MAKSLKDSMKELEEMNNAKIMSDDITAYSLEAASFSSPVVDNETTLATTYTISYRICTDLEYLIVYSLFLKLLSYLIKRTVCIALWLRTSIQH